VRDVSIKMLPPAFTADRERLARFERDTRLLASLNHPHIAAIYGVEEARPVTGSGPAMRALVLELVEGETLAERLPRGPLMLPQALPLALQIADALDHAHRRGITHRDLKPANVLLTKAGVKAARLRKSRVVEMRFFGGLSVEETAEALHVSADTVKRAWRLAKLWLLRELEGTPREHES
jgi:serine/threonine protein kinase